MATKWIFFDCFNTLLDDFDQDGDETGMLPIAHIPAEAGYFPDANSYYKAYVDWRKSYWTGDRWDEVHLEDRFTTILKAQQVKEVRQNLQETVEQMMRGFHEAFPKLVRKTPGVETMLERYSGKVKMGVVSNFFLPGYPANLLKQFGLDHYFDFVLDSAEVNLKKPGREIYRLALQRAGLSPEESSEVLFIGDNVKNDALAPKNLGMQGIHFDRSDVRPNVIKSTEVPSIRKWEEFQIAVH